MFTMRSADVPEPWRVLRSPIERRSTKSLDALAPDFGPPASWHEITSEQARVLLRVTDPLEDLPPVISGVVVSPGDDPLASLDGKTLRAVPIEEVGRAISARWAGEQLVGRLREIVGDWADQPLTRPDRSDPGRFYAHVALRYLHHLAETVNPTWAIAQEAGVPHPTAQRWVVEARRRKHLPPARKGRAG